MSRESCVRPSYTLILLTSILKLYILDPDAAGRLPGDSVSAPGLESHGHSALGARDTAEGNRSRGSAVGPAPSLQPMGKEMGKPFLDLERQRSLFPLFPSDLVGLGEIPGEHLLHLNGELTAQNDRIHLVIT